MVSRFGPVGCKTRTLSLIPGQRQRRRLGRIATPLPVPAEPPHRSNSTHYTVHSTLHTLRPSLYTLHATLYTLHHALFTLHSALYTRHSTLYSLYPTCYTLHPSLSTFHAPAPNTLSLLLCLLLYSVTGPRRSLSLKLSDTRVYEPPKVQSLLGPP
jgi:hypothetical protein